MGLEQRDGSSIFGLSGLAAQGRLQGLGLQQQQATAFVWNDPRSYGLLIPPDEPKPKTIREELQAETDEWLGDW